MTLLSGGRHKGASVQWTAMGEGEIDLVSVLRAFKELCPGIPVHIETISGFAREFPYLDPTFWKAWPQMPAASFARFVALAERGKPRSPWEPPGNADRTKAEQDIRRANSSTRSCTAVRSSASGGKAYRVLKRDLELGVRSWELTYTNPREVRCG